LTECSDLSEAEVEGMEMEAVAVKTAVALETAVVTITTVALTVKTVVMMVNTAATLRMAVTVEVT
jgi:hypothetical protein